MTEYETIKQYMPFIKSVAERFSARCRMPLVALEDLEQEAVLAFIQHIRTHKQDEYTRCGLTLINAMYDCVRREYPLHVPHGKFNSVMHSTSFVSLNSIRWTEMIDEHALDEMELMEAVEALQPDERQLLILKTKGLTSREAARLMGISECKACRILKRCREQMTDGRRIN